MYVHVHVHVCQSVYCRSFLIVNIINMQCASVNIINMQCASVPTLQVVHVHVGLQIHV